MKIDTQKALQNIDTYGVAGVMGAGSKHLSKAMARKLARLGLVTLTTEARSQTVRKSSGFHTRTVVCVTVSLTPAGRAAASVHAESCAAKPYAACVCA